MSTKSHRRIVLALAGTVVLVAGWMFAAKAQEQAAGPDTGQAVLLLRNGHTLEGRVTADDENFNVQLDNGEVHVKRGDVLCVCRDLVEVYSRKRSLIRMDNAQDHVDLARWCLHATLTDAAAGELADARAIDATHPMIPLLERELKVALSQPGDNRRANKSSEPVLSSFDLDRLVRSMPPKTVEMFAQTVQPLLMNECTASGCHSQLSESKFRLLRAPSGTTPSRRLTQRNLYAALQLVDQNNPAASSLLTVPMHPHGTAKAAIFNDRQLAEYRQLVEWCNRVAQIEGQLNQVSYVEQHPLPPRVRPAPRPSRSSSHPHYTPKQGPAAAERSPAGDDAASDAPAAGKRAAPKEYPPTDPNDPEVFNRRYGPAKNPGSPNPGSPLPDQLPQ
jgi:hypothetical protein